MTFLNCYYGVLRHKSLFLGELSNMVSLDHKRDRDVYPMTIQVMQIATGKTVKGKLKQFGHCMRHTDVTSCAVGAMGLYFLFRFQMSREMDEGDRPDF